METNIKTIGDRSRVIRRTVYFQYPTIESKDGLNIHIQNYEYVEDKLILTFRIEELESENFSVYLNSNHLVISVAVNKQYSLFNKPDKPGSSDLLKLNSNYSVVCRAEVSLPEENFTQIRTINFPDNKLLKLVLRHAS
jgi:hypothetical protein